MQIFSLVLILVLFLGNVNSLKILFYQTVVSASHSNFAKALIDSLVERSHVVDKIVMEWNTIDKNVTDLSRKTTKITVSKDEISWGSMKHTTDPLDPRNSLQFDDENVLKMRKIMCKNLISRRDFLETLKLENYDIGLSSIYDSCGFGLLHILGIKSTSMYSATHLSDTVIWIMGIPMPPSYLSDWLNWPSIGQKMTFFDRLNSIFLSLKIVYKLEFMNQGEQEIFNHYYPNFPSLTHLSQKNTYIFINSHEILDISRPITGKIKYVGGVGIKEPKKLDHKWEKILSLGKNGVVIFSFGSVVKTTVVKENIKQAFKNVFREFKNYLFIWKYDEIEADGEFYGENIYLVKWIPQNDLLYDHRVKAFITHMGLNSYLESAHAGMPLIGIPLLTDQSYNAHAAIQNGMGVLLKKDNISEESITGVLKEILENPKYLQKTQEISRILAASKSQTTPEEIFVKHVELAARFPNLSSYLQLGSVELNYWTYFCIDVLLFCLLTTLFLIFFMRFLCKKIFKMFISKETKIKSS